MSENVLAMRLRASLVDFVDRLIPKRLLRLLVHPKFQALVGPERIETVGRWVDNTFKC